MNEKVNADVKSIKFIYDKNKQYILPFAIILVCIILFFQFIIPQFGSLVTARKEIEDASLKLEQLKSNLKILINTDDNSLDSQLNIVNHALPLNKDFEAIFNSIEYASQKAGVTVGSFSLQIGDLSKIDKNEKSPSIKVALPINGGVNAVNIFAKTLINSVPLAEISQIKIGDVSSTVNLSFYYKPLDSSVGQDAKVNPITQKGLLLIDKLKSFENISP